MVPVYKTKTGQETSGVGRLAFWPFGNDVLVRFDSNDERARAYREVFSTEQGKRVLADLMLGVGMMETPAFVAGQPDTTAYNLGRKEAVFCIIKEIKEGANG